MEVVKAVDSAKSLSVFFGTMFGEQRGFVYSPTKEWCAERTWKTYFFEWPAQKDELIEHALTKSVNHDVYYAPALLTRKEVPKLDSPDIFAGSYWVWAEFDYGIPNGDLLNKFTVPQPTIRIRTSEPGHEHWYWRINRWQQDPEALRDVTQRLAYALEADVCFDWGRVLRVPYTIHHESQMSVELITMGGQSNSYKAFDNVPEVEHEPISDVDLGTIPEALKVLFSYKMLPDTIDLLFKNKDQLAPKDDGTPGSRSSALMRLGYDCAEAGMSNEEMFAVLQNKDFSWGKYAEWDRPKKGMPLPDNTRQKKNLVKIINIVRVTHPLTLPGDLDEDFPIMGFLDLVKSDIHVEWVIKDLIHKEGLWMITGLAQAGKSQLAVWMLAHIALGKNILDRWIVPEALKVLFFSMEMSFAEIKKLLSDMQPNFTEEEQQKLNENLLIWPLGFAVELDNKEAQKIINKKIDEFEPEGIVFDSLGIAIGEDLKDAKAINATFRYVKKEINRDRNCFVGFIHHNVKPQASDRKPNKAQHIFGSSYILNHVRSVVGLWRTNEKDPFSDIEVDCLKLSLAPQWPGFRIKRTKPNLGFVVSGKGTGFDTVTEQDFEDLTSFSLNDKDDDNGSSSGFDLA